MHAIIDSDRDSSVYASVSCMQYRNKCIPGSTMGRARGPWTFPTLKVYSVGGPSHPQLLTCHKDSFMITLRYSHVCPVPIHNFCFVHDHPGIAGIADHISTEPCSPL